MTIPDGIDPSLVLFDPEGESVLAWSRPDGPRDGVDAVSELAVLAAASGLPCAALVIPVRLRDLARDDIVARSHLVTRLERSPRGDVDLQAYAFDPDHPPPTPLDRDGTWAMDPDMSPVAALLFDAMVRVADVPAFGQVAAVLTIWGHEVAVRGPLPETNYPRLGRDRHRVHRLARELGRRNRPVGRAGHAARPGVPANLPPGFVPACPL